MAFTSYTSRRHFFLRLFKDWYSTIQNAVQNKKTPYKTKA